LAKEAATILDGLLPTVGRDMFRRARRQSGTGAAKTINRVCGAFILGKAPTPVTLKTLKTPLSGCVPMGHDQQDRF
jgi:hypothetical protein